MKVLSIVAVVALFVAANAAPIENVAPGVPVDNVAPVAPVEDAAPVQAEFVTLNIVHTEVVPGEWLIKLRRGANYTQAYDLIKGHAGRDGNKLLKSWSGFKGFAGKFDQVSIREIQSLDDVEFVEPEQKFTIVTTQTPVPSWGLARISSQARQSTSYTYPDTAGSGITAYVIDTGVLATHTDFGGRARLAVNFVNSQNTDCNGHGTHVSGTIAGTKYGVAKKANIVGVKVLDCDGSGTTSGIISGVDWVTKNAVKGKSGTHWSNSLLKLRSRSPARTPSAFTVGATTSTDAKASYSSKCRVRCNYGTCVDIWAPGTDIKSAWIGSNSATNVISGTSMASPHAAGVGALFLSAGTSAFSLYSKMTSVSSKGYIT
ncbi:peptidase S8/S53 domain-containing protein, partial [Jimgerdemannia flammicorona]